MAGQFIGWDSHFDREVDAQAGTTSRLTNRGIDNVENGPVGLLKDACKAGIEQCRNVFHGTSDYGIADKQAELPQYPVEGWHRLDFFKT